MLSSSSIVWAHGPFAAGKYPDLSIFRSHMCEILAENERVLADRGYRNSRCLTPYDCIENRKVHSDPRARHEAVNLRLKHFNVLQQSFRHKLDLHGLCFHAIVHLVQILLHDEPLFSVNF